MSADPNLPDPELSGLDIKQLSAPSLLKLSRTVVRELRSRGIVRSSNAPAGDYAEYLIRSVTGGTLAPNSQKSWDVITPAKVRLQVKARVLTPENPSRQLSPIRSWDFDTVAVVLFNDDFSLKRAVFLEREVAEAAAVWRDHVNGWILFARDQLLAAGTDRTDDVVLKSYELTGRPPEP